MTHQEVAELLPWYVNATLAEAERRAVEAHLTVCRDCALDLEQLRSIGAAARELAAEGPAPAPGGLAAALRRIEDHEAARRATILGRLEQRWSLIWNATPAVARVALAVQMALLGGLGVWTSLRAGRPTLETVSGPGARTPHGTGVTLLVGFVEGAPEGALRRALLDIRGTIVAGPSALGLYTVEVPIPADRPHEVERILDALRKNHEVVRFAARQF